MSVNDIPALVHEGAVAKLSCPLCGIGAVRRYTLEHTIAYQCPAHACQLQFASPQLDDERLQGAYEALYYPATDNKHAILENAPEFEVRTLIATVEHRAGGVRGKRILDYGCGNGLLLRIAQEMGAEAIGIEQSSTARSHIEEQKYGRAYSNIQELVENHTRTRFDCIFMCDVVEHLREPWLELHELRCLLSSSGKIFLTTPNCNSLRSRLAGSAWDQRKNLTHFYYFNSRSLAKVLARAGYQKIAELPPITTYSHHGPLRRSLQQALAHYGLQGGLLFMASN